MEGLARLSSPIFRFTFHLLHLFVVAGWKGRLFRGGWASSSQPSFWHLHSYALIWLCLRRPVMCFPLLGLLQFLQQCNDSCNVLFLFVVCEVEGPSIHCPSSPFQVYFMSCFNCCCCVGWAGSSQEVGPCSLNDCLGICIGFILVVCAC